MSVSFWVISCGTPDAELVRQAIAGSRYPIRSFVSAGTSLATLPKGGIEQSTGAILVLDKHALESPDFVDTARSLVAMTLTHDNFLIVPWLKDFSLSELEDLARAGNPLASTLVDNIQLNTSVMSIDGVRICIEDFLNNQFRQLANLARYRRFAAISSRISGEFAQGLVPILVLTAGIGLFVRDKDAADRANAIHLLLTIASFACVPVFIANLHCIWDLRSCGYRSFSRSLTCQVIFSILLAYMYIFVQSGETGGIRLDIAPIGIGLAVGITVIELERNGRRARWGVGYFSDLPKLIQSKGRLLDFLYDSIQPALANPGAPIFAPMHKRIFISYARSSPWSSRVAHEIATELRNLGAFVFLDRTSLMTGMSWKEQLRFAISTSNVFVAVIDETAMTREWIAAEFATAYLIKMVRRTPEIFVIHPRAQNFLENDDPTQAFFSELMIRPSRPIPLWMRSQMGVYDPETFSAMCRAIRWYPIAGLLGHKVNSMFGAITAQIIQINGFAQIVGSVLGVFFLGYFLTKPITLIANPRLILLLGVVSAFLGAFAFRCLAFWLAEDVRPAEDKPVTGLLELVSGMVFITIAAYCVLAEPTMTIFVIVFLGLVWGVGCGSYYAICTRTFKQQDNTPK